MEVKFSLTTIEFVLLVVFVLFLFIGLALYIVRNQRQSSSAIEGELDHQNPNELRDDDLL